MANVTLNPGASGAVMATEQNASAPNENYQIIEIASGAGAAFANKLTITAAGAAKIDASGTTIQANAGTNLNTSALALESGGNLASLLGRLPATAALADATANPTLTAVQNFLMGFNGTTWDRLKATSGSLNVHLDAQTVTVSGTVTANIGTSGSLALESGNLSTLLGRFPAPAALADATANPTLSALQVYLMGYNGTTWDRVKATSGKLLVTPDSVALPAHQSTNVDQWAGTAVDTNSGVKSAGTLRVVLATDQPQLTNALLAAQSGTWTVQPGNTANTTPWLVSQTPATSGGLSTQKYILAATTNAQTVKASAGQLYGLQAFNNGSAPIYVKVYNKASAPTVGTDTPVKVIEVPANATAANGAGVAINFGDSGVAFGAGIAIAVTGGITDADTTATAANQGVVNFDYK